MKKYTKTSFIIAPGKAESQEDIMQGIMGYVIEIKNIFHDSPAADIIGNGVKSLFLTIAIFINQIGQLRAIINHVI